MKNRTRRNRTLLALLTTLAMVFSMLSLTVFAKGTVSIAVDWTGESGSTIEATENSISIPLKITAEEGGGELDHFDANLLQPKSFLTNADRTEKVYPTTCENIGTSEDGYCFVKLNFDNLTVGTAYVLCIAQKGTGPNNSYGTEEYNWTLPKNYMDDVVVTSGDPYKKIQWGDNQIDNQTQVQVIYYSNGILELADSGSGEMKDYTSSGNSAWSKFFYPKTIKSIDIRDGVKHIGNYTFSPLINVTTVTTGNLDPLTSIGEYSFKGCTSLKDVYLYADAEDMNIADTAFDGCSDVTIHVKADQLEAYQARFPDLANVTFVGDLTPDAPVEPTFELTSSEGTDLKAKKHTNLTAEVTNGNVEDYTYKFIVYNKTTNQWYKLRDFDAANTFDWYTGPAGEKTLYVDVKDAEGNVTREALDVTVADSTLKVDSFTIGPTGELATKTQAALSATASGGAGEYQYKFIVYNDTTKQWYKLKDFGPESTFDWYTGPAGTKTLYVDVKDADGTVVRAPLDVTVA